MLGKLTVQNGQPLHLWWENDFLGVVMKKIILFLFFMLVAFPFVVAGEGKVDTDYAMPAIDKENAFFIDVNTLGGRKIEGLRIVSYSDMKNIAYDVYAHSPITQKWEFLGSAVIKGFGDRSIIGREYKNLPNCRYFAVVPQMTGDFDFFIEKNKQGLFQKDLLSVEIRSPEYVMEDSPKPPFSEQNAYVTREEQIPPKAKRNIMIVNRTSRREISVRIFGYSKKMIKWVPLGTVETKVTNARNGLHLKNSKIEDYYYFAFAGSSAYDCSFSAEKGDLVVTVRD